MKVMALKAWAHKRPCYCHLGMTERHFREGGSNNTAKVIWPWEYPGNKTDKIKHTSKRYFM